MLYTKIFALTFALATGALAAPSADASISKPSKPSKPSAPVIINQANQQKNSCGNDVTSYCCNSDSGKYTNCKTLDGSNTCSTTIVCCNAAQFAQQVCIA